MKTLDYCLIASDSIIPYWSERTLHLMVETNPLLQQILNANNKWYWSKKDGDSHRKTVSHGSGQQTSFHPISKQQHKMYTFHAACLCNIHCLLILYSGANEGYRSFTSVHAMLLSYSPVQVDLNHVFRSKKELCKSIHTMPMEKKKQTGKMNKTHGNMFLTVYCSFRGEGTGEKSSPTEKVVQKKGREEAKA